MKKIDFKSAMIGFLLCLSIFLMMGQNKGNMGDIIVDSITLLNSDGYTTAFLGNGEDGSYFHTT